MTVIAFPTKPPPDRIVWVCACGCSTFYILPGKRAECAACMEPLNPDQSEGWNDVDEPPVPPEVPRPTIVRPLVDMNDPNYNMRAVMAHASHTDSAIVLVVQQDGDLHFWHDQFETPEQADWVRGRLDRACENILGSCGVERTSLSLFSDRMKSRDDLHSAILIRQDGDVSTWQNAESPVETDEQKAWYDRKLAIARELITDKEYVAPDLLQPDLFKEPTE